MRLHYKLRLYEFIGKLLIIFTAMNTFTKLNPIQYNAKILNIFILFILPSLQYHMACHRDIVYIMVCRVHELANDPRVSSEINAINPVDQVLRVCLDVSMASYAVYLVYVTMRAYQQVSSLAYFGWPADLYGVVEVNS